MTLGPIAEPETVNFARRLLAARRIRHCRMQDISLGDPSWDMLIDLFVATETGCKLSVMSLTLATPAPRSTAVLAINRLVQEGHLIRSADPDDGRRFYIRFSPDLHRNLDRTLSEMRLLVSCDGPDMTPSRPH
jgi:hypothetical protein